MAVADLTADWIRRYHPAHDAGVRLVCLPHAGGSASFYFAMSRDLAPQVEVLAVQYPGRQDRRLEPCLTSISEFADQVTAVIAECADKPLALFGHSMGATIAFEVTRRIEAAGQEVVALFVSARRAPSRYRRQTVHLRPDNGILDELRSLDGTASPLLADGEMVQLILPAVRNDYRAAETYEYRPGPPLATPIYAFMGESDPWVNLDEQQAWQAHTSGGFESRTYAGGHFYLNEHRRAVIDVIIDRLIGTVNTMCNSLPAKMAQWGPIRREPDSDEEPSNYYPRTSQPDRR